METQINLYECPKCRQLKLENTYIKNGVYYSTCKECRDNKGIEENYINKNSYLFAIIKGSDYSSDNKSSITNVHVEEHADLQKKTTLLNALIARLIENYTEFPASIDTNYHFINMLKKLTSISTKDISFDGLKAVLKEKFKYSIAKNTLEDSKIVVELNKASSNKLLGIGMQTSEYEIYNLKLTGCSNKKQIRATFSKNRKAIIKTMLEEQEPICYLCENHLAISDITIDHVKPIACGGTNDPENLKFACRDCNCLKGSQTLEEFKGLKKQVVSPVNLKKVELLSENKTLKINSNFATEQIAYYTEVQRNLVSRMSKNINTLKSIEEYEELSKRMKEIEDAVL